jgi:uncharacterized protein YndB with AHSA1/START domain
MAPITSSIEIARRPEDVFAYVTDPTRLAEWQESVIRSESSDKPVRIGTKAQMTRRFGRREMTSAAEITELTPPTSWSVRGLDGAVRGNVEGRIEPLDGGARSRVMIVLDLQGHGIGKLLVPLFVKRQAQQELPRNMENLKTRLEQTA